MSLSDENTQIDGSHILENKQNSNESIQKEKDNQVTNIINAFKAFTSSTTLEIEKTANKTEELFKQFYINRVVALIYIDKVLVYATAKTLLSEPQNFISIPINLVLMITMLIEKGREVDKRRIYVGRHMVIIPKVYKDADMEFSENITLKAGNKFGQIDFMRNFPVLPEGGNLIAFVREAFDSSHKSLEELAELCVNNDPRLKGIEVFYGISHLAGPLAKRLGFQILEIENQTSKTIYKTLGNLIATTKSKENEDWQKIKKNTKDPQVAYITRTELIKLFSRKSDLPISTP